MKYQVGDLVEAIDNTAGHNQVGHKGEVTMLVPPIYYRLEGSAMSFAEADLRLLRTPRSRISERLAKAKREYLRYQEQYDYLVDTELDSLSREEFQDYVLQKLLNKADMTAEEKASRIRAVFEE